MLRTCSQLGGLTVRATDGDIGTVQTVYFDDDRWTIRYFVVDAGGWLSGRKVLLSPISVREANWTDGHLDVALTKDQVKNSPDIDTERPVSRQHEVRYYGYYGYPYYWAGSGLWGPAAYPAALAAPYASPEARTTTAARAEAAAQQEASDAQHSHLRSATVVKGYHIHATDGEIGHVDDFLIDDESWAIRYLLVDTSNWLGGRRVLVAPSWIREVSWDASMVYVSITRDAVQNSPAYEPTSTVTRPYEERLYSHYGREAYWSSGTPLRRLDESVDPQVASGQPDVKDWEVVASDGRRIGTVEHLIADPAAMTIRYLEVGLEEGLPGIAGNRDVLIPMELVDLDKNDEKVRVRVVASDRVAHLPAFTGFPLVAGYDDQFRTGIGVAAGSLTSGSSNLRLSRAAATTDRWAGTPAARTERSPQPPSQPETFTAQEQIVNRAPDEPGEPGHSEPSREPHPGRQPGTPSRRK